MKAGGEGISRLLIEKGRRSWSCARRKLQNKTECTGRSRACQTGLFDAFLERRVASEGPAGGT